MSCHRFDFTQLGQHAQFCSNVNRTYKVHIEDGPLYIGTIGDHPSALIVSNNLRNVPDFGLVAGWDLGFPGTADPEQFYFAE